jgi:hypothetical protein
VCPQDTTSPHPPIGADDTFTAVFARLEVQYAVYLAERRMSGLTDADVRAVERALVQASRRVSGEGSSVRYVRSSYVADAQRWVGLFVSTSPEAVHRVFGIAQVPDGSVIEVADAAALDDPGVTPSRPERW